MPMTGFWPRAAALALALIAQPLAGQAAQDIPRLPPGMTAEQARSLLQQRPELQERLRQWIATSGLSANEIRARLRAAGYPGDILDEYLSVLTRDTSAVSTTIPSVQALDAVRSLGLADPDAGDSLLALGDSVGARLFRDSVEFARMERDDSLRRRALRLGRLELFGERVFRTAATAFDPIVPGPVDDAYILGPGDVLAVMLTGATEAAFTTDVLPDGYVLLPQAGRVSVTNLSLGDARRLLFDRLRTVYATLGRGPEARTRLDVTVSQVRMNSVRVVGEVLQPGTYQVAATGGVLTAMYAAGGPTHRGNWRQVEVRRGERLVATVDLYDYLLTGTITTGVSLAPGDVVFVREAGPRVKVAGAVRRAAIYELKPGEGVREAVRFAGGLTYLAATETATIAQVLPPAEREAPGFAHVVRTIPLGAVLAGTATDVRLGDGDSLTIFVAPADRRLGVTVAGAVFHPGTYELLAGMRLGDALAAAGGVRPESYQGRVQVLRTHPDSTREMFGAALPAEGGGPALTDGDSIVVYARTAFRPPRFVAVGGAVQLPDTFPFADSMTLRDAVLLAGGVTDGASLIEAVITRPRLADGSGRIAETIRVPLDSSYVFDATAYVARPARGGAPDVVLHPFDAVTILTQPGWRPAMRVTLTGEVAQPGVYLIETEGERLSSVIARAGGLTPRALPGGVAFYRTRVAGATRIGVDIQRALRSPGDAQDLLLLAGDSIHIPQLDPTVRVEGAVNAPTVVPFWRGSGIRTYVDAAGGFAQEADRRQTYVMQANGIVERGGTPGPGSTVVVPAKNLELDRPSNWPIVLGALSSVVGALTTLMVVIAR